MRGIISLVTLSLSCFGLVAFGASPPTDEQVGQARKWLLLDRPAEVEKCLRKPMTIQAKAMRAICTSNDNQDDRELGLSIFDASGAERMAQGQRTLIR
ncbi:hypothetical protein Sinac_4164 [Singulisphaera acidiphila DSM 18658]|uniref:Uncharacterized protein n=1 Tax=Singulisphaera acidiphila (strain ATCC BAA-1392 / DSM 18658 / VKM B-2454 / MOB10) TaxID=886293 RepID=L0DIB4_SINAD|nr:hypothetical protein Sinac_4164 [Singulisphaera acidiphila DSM 18658]